MNLNSEIKNNPGSDWIGIYKKGSSNSWSNVVAWAWIANELDGKFEKSKLGHLGNGEYQARYFFNNSYKVESSKTFTPNASNANISILEQTKDKITLKSSRVGYQTWIGIYKKGSSNAWSNVKTWSWVHKDQTRLNIKNLPKARYEARLFYNNSYKLESKIDFSISSQQNQNRYIPSPNTTWNIQLNGKINPNYNATLYEIDLFNAGTAMIEKLHQKGKKVICYLNAGCYEWWREDSNQFPEETLGNVLEEWNGERWLDIRSPKLRPIMSKRLAVAKQKGCDGVEADNVNGHENPTGFNITLQDQLNYNKFLANEAHKHGLSIGLKNDLDQIVELEPYYDFSINEECNQYEECELLKPFVDANKLVINVEYLTQNKEQYCNNSKSMGLSILFLPLKLDGTFRMECR
jgi:hypothetical protein